MAYDWAAGLGGLGAALQGNYPEWQVAETDRKNRLAELDEKRLKAMAMDFDASLTDLNAGNVGSAWERLLNRHEQIIKLGGDPTHTENLMKMFKEGRLDEAKAKLTQSRQAAIQDGLIEVKEPKTPTFRTAENGDVYMWDNASQKWALTDSGGAKFKSTGTNVTVQNNLPGEKYDDKYSEELAKVDIDRYRGIRDAAANAQDYNYQLDALEGFDLETGWGTGGKVQLAKLMNFIIPGTGNVIIKSVGPYEAFEAISQKLVNSELNTAKGPQTEGDAIRAQKTVAGLGKTKEANTFIINHARALNDRKIEQEKFWTDYMEQNKNLKGVESAWVKYKNSTPLLSDPRFLVDPKTGMPKFYNQFVREVRQKFPDRTIEEINAKWRRLNNGEE